MTEVSEMIFCERSVKFDRGPPVPIGEQSEKQERRRGGAMLEGNRGPCWSLASWGHPELECPK